MPPSPPAEVDAALLRGWPLPQPDDRDSKEERGRVLVVGSHAGVPGAVLLAGEAALRVGAGKLQLATSLDAAPALAAAVPEALVVGFDEGDDVGKVLADRAAGAHAIVIGVGSSEAEHDEVRETVRMLVALDGPSVIVLDAGAITSLGEGGREVLGSSTGRVVLTPNPAEAAALAGCAIEDVRDDPMAIARRLVDDLGVVVAVKGPTTYTCAPDGRAFADAAGNVGLGTSGSGDVASGAVAGLAARGADPVQATVFGMHLHAVAGDRLARRIGPIGYLARELSGEFPAILRELTP